MRRIIKFNYLCAVLECQAKADSPGSQHLGQDLRAVHKCLKQLTVCLLTK